MGRLTSFQAAQVALFLAIIAVSVMLVGYGGSDDTFRDVVVCPIRAALHLDTDCDEARSAADSERKRSSR